MSFLFRVIPNSIVVPAKAGASSGRIERREVAQTREKPRIKSGMTMGCWMTLVAAALLPTPVTAQDTMPPAPYAYRQLDDPLLEAEARELMETLRCLTCQSQSIADSDAPLAGDMRHQVRTRIAAGDEPEEVRQWLVERYGDYVSYAPRVTQRTWPLFAIPALLLVIAMLIIRRRLGARK